MNYSLEMQQPRTSFASLMLVAALHIALIAGLIFGLKTVSVVMQHEKNVILVPVPPEPIKPPVFIDKPIPVNLITPPPPDVLPPPTTEPVIREKWIEPIDPTKGKIAVTPENHPAQVAKTENVFTSAIVDAKSCDKPDYPRNALRNGDTGIVTLELLIGQDGRVSESRIAKSSGHRELDQAAVAGLSLCKFKPATLNGQAQKSWAKLEYAWNLDN